MVCETLETLVNLTGLSNTTCDVYLIPPADDCNNLVCTDFDSDLLFSLTLFPCDRTAFISLTFIDSNASAAEVLAEEVSSSPQPREFTFNLTEEAESDTSVLSLSVEVVRVRPTRRPPTGRFYIVEMSSPLSPLLNIPTTAIRVNCSIYEDVTTASEFTTEALTGQIRSSARQEFQLLQTYLLYFISVLVLSHIL